MRGLNHIRKEIPKKTRVLKDKRTKRESARLKKYIKDEVDHLYEDMSSAGTEVRSY